MACLPDRQAQMVRVLPAFIRDIRVICGQECFGPCFGCGSAALCPSVVGLVYSEF
jgi:hypothetical protein